ncbi:Thiamine pyrophosphokinase [Candidatus Magnetomorum sp. HK-1]|nr:Thiamine pyrophosphokinase [Candidatus Magnetomorum sp. HK-1]
MRSIIFANGQMRILPSSIKPIEKNDIIIAADGGLRFCRKFNIIPNLIVGDLDSIDQTQLSEMEDKGVEIIKHPVRKDETDLELSLKVALDKGVSEIIILGALGARWDMTFSNALILAADYLKNMHVRLIDDYQEIICIKNNKKFFLKNHAGFMLSILPISGIAEGITMRGMEYELVNENLPMGSTRGLSNVIIDNDAFIQVNRGKLLVIINTKN